MYRFLESRLALAGLSKKELCSITGINYNTFITKLNGGSDFTLSEAISIKKAVGCDVDIEILFEKVA